ncbi:hypothetical protein L7F22_017017 [Adiantum nelumboides]|nr:hypothetical protein [Adiantum nelumboides]
MQVRLSPAHGVSVNKTFYSEAMNKSQISGVAPLPAPPDAVSPSVSSTSFNEIMFLINAGRLEQALQALLLVYAQGIVPHQHIYWSYLKACNRLNALFSAKQLHAHLVFYGQEFVSSLGDYLLSTLFACGGFELAVQLFLALPRKTVFSWKAVITGYIDYGLEQQAMCLFKKMLEDGVEPDKYTYAIVIKGCGHLVDLEQGKAIHADAQERGLHRDAFVVSALIRMYGKCKCIVEAEYVFGNSKMLGDIVLWNTMLSAYVEQGEAEKALQLYRQMQEEGPPPDSRTFVIVISACCILAEKEETAPMCLAIGEALHSDARRMGFDSNAILGNNLLRMYGKCGCLTRAENVFTGMLEQNVVSWTLLLDAYLELGEEEATLQLYRQMQQERVHPDEKIMVVALQACCSLARKEEAACVDGQMTKEKSLAIGKALNHDAKSNNFDADCFVNITLIGMYGSCGRVAEAENVFAGLVQHNLVAFNVMLSAYVECGKGDLAICLFRQMHEEGVQTDERTIVIAMQACSILADNEIPLVVRGRPVASMALEIGRSLHCDAFRRGFCSDSFVEFTILSMYKQCGSLVDAENLVSGSVTQNSLCWTELLSLYASNGECERSLLVFRHMQEEGVSPNRWAYLMAIQGCSAIAERGGVIGPSGESVLVVALLIGQALHSDAFKNGFSSDLFVSSSLLTLYGKCGDIIGAEDVFIRLSQPDIVSCNAMLSVYLEQGNVEKVLKLYRSLVCPNEGTFVAALQACCMLVGNRGATIAVRGSSHIMPIEIGRALHVDALRKGLGSFPLVCSVLIIMYSTCGSMAEVESMFNWQLQHDIVSWSALMSAYIEHGQAEKALQLYILVQQEGIAPDEHTFILAFEACAGLAEKEEVSFKDGQLVKQTTLEIGHALHADCLSMGFILNASVYGNVVHMYGKCMNLTVAENAFNALPHDNILPWNAMLSTYIDHGQGEKALSLYRLVQVEGVPVDEFTLFCVLQACSLTADVQMCREVHFLIECAGSSYFGKLTSVLTYVYGSCATMGDCQAMFDSIVEADVASWNAVISGHMRKGDHRRSMQTFEQMQLSNLVANRATALLLLSSCSHAGDVEGSIEQFESMSLNHGITPDMEHFKGIIDLLGRAGDFTNVKELVDGLVLPTLSVWLNVLGACQNHGTLELGNWAFDQAMCLQPKHAKAYITISNIYAREEHSNELFMHEILSG